MTIEEVRQLVNERVIKKVEDNPEGAKEIGKTVALEVTGKCECRWIVDCSVDPACITESDDTAAATISVDSESLGEVISGDLSPEKAFLSGKIKVDGDLGAAVRLGQLIM